MKQAINPNYLEKPYRRHNKACGSKNPQDFKCSCPIYAQGRLRGEYVRIPTGKRSMQEALVWCEQKVAWAKNPDQNPDPDTPPEGIHVVKTDSKNKTVAEAVQIFNEQSTYKASSTESGYTHLTHHFQSYIEARGVTALKAVEPMHIVEYFQAHEAVWRSEATKQSKLIRLKCFFNFCVEMRWLTASPIKKGWNFDSPSTTEPFEPEEVTRILAAIDQLPAEQQAKARALILTMLASGLRIADCSFLEREYVDDQGRLQHYMIKGNKQLAVKIRLQDWCLEALRALPASRVYFFLPDRDDDYAAARKALRTPRKKGSASKKARFDELVGKKFYDRAIRENAKLVLEVLILAGLHRYPWGHRRRNNADEKVPRQGLCHRFRDTFATTLIMAGVPIVAVSRMLGHHSVTVTDKYYAKIIRKYAEQVAEVTDELNYQFPPSSANRSWAAA